MAGRSAAAAWNVTDGALTGTSVLAVAGVALAIHLLLAARKAHRALAAERAEAADQRARLESDLAGAETVLIQWPAPGSEPQDESARSFEALAEVLAADDFERLRDAIGTLRNEGTAFRLDLRSADQTRRLEARGVTAPDGGASLWLRDDTPRATREEALTTEAESLKAEAERLRTVLDAIDVPIWRRDGALDLNWCNATYAASVDSSVDVALAEGGIELISNVPRSEARALAKDALESHTPARARRHVVVDGERRLFEIAERPAADGGGTIGWATDVTDLETTQSDLKRHIDAHAEVLEALNTAIAIYSANKRLIFFNSEFFKLYRLDEHWLASEPTLGEVLEAQREQRRLPEEADWRAFKKRMSELFTNLTTPQEELLHLPDDTTLRCIISPHPFGGLQFMTLDVTDRLALERSYSTLTAVQRATLDNLYEAVAVFGADGRLKLSNPGYAKLWSFDPYELDGEPHMTELIDRSKELIDYNGEWDAYKADYIAHITERQHTTSRLFRHDGKVLDCSFVPLPDGATLLTYLDITDRFQVEHALRERAEALETADRLKSEFLANVSYELRTPLNTVIGFTEILLNQYFGPLNERQQEYVRGTLESSQHLLSLINNILDLATIEAGLMVLEIESVDVHETLLSMLNLVQERVRKKHLTVSFECEREVGRLDADERRLKQIVFNLLSNAINFTPAGGTVTLGAQRDDGFVSIWVSDTGIGIDADDLDRVFDKFSQARNAPGRQTGTGLGLSLVKNFVELHGGRIQVDSAPGNGTTVTCLFPVRALPQAVNA